MRRRTAGWLAAAVVLAGPAAAGVAYGLGGGDRPAPTSASRPPATAPVTQADLVDYIEVPGVLGFGEERPLRYTPPAAPPVDRPPDPSADARVAPSASPERGGVPGDERVDAADDPQGLVTWLPAVGATVRRGGTLFRVDNTPVVLLIGDVPVYRSMRAGVSGPDVRTLERNLRALGYGGFTVDDAYTEATGAAVRRWQRDLGVPRNGVVAPGRAIVAPGAIRVAGHALRVGDRAEGEILRMTDTGRTITAELEQRHAAYARRGIRVVVELAGGRTVDGVVAAAGAAAAGPAAGGAADAVVPGREATVPVRVTLKDQAGVRDAPPGPVRLRLVATHRRDVLTVPVAALVALAEGGFGVETVDGDARRYVAVRTGLFAAGRVEVTADGLRPGMLVVVPK